MVREEYFRIPGRIGVFRGSSPFGKWLLGIICCFCILSFSGCQVSLAEGAETLFDMPAMGGLMVHQVGDGLVVMDIKGTALPRPELLRDRPDALEFLFFNVSLASGRWEKDYSLPLVRKIVLSQESRGVLMRVETNVPLSLRILRGDAPANHLSMELERKDRLGAASPRVPQPSPVPYSSLDPMGNRTPVTLELHGVSLKDVFRMLARTMKMNIICDPSTPDTPVTLNLQHVPLQEAFSYLMRMYGIRYAIMGKTLLIGKDGDLARTLGKEITRSYHVAYGDPAEVAKLLQGLASVENVTVDSRLREIYVTASPSKLYKVEQILQRVDHPGKQVMIQARIVETRADNSDSLESIISGVYKHWYFSYGAGGGTIGYIDTNLVDKYDPDKDDGSIVIPDGIDVDSITNNTMRMLDAGLNSLVKEDKGEVLARPSVITIAGEKASIKLTTQTKYISGKDEAGNPTYGDVEAGPTLEFLPTIGRENMLNLDIKVSTGNVTFKQSGSALYPEKSSREVETKIRVRNGEPFVIGGLFSHSKSENETKFPILGDIPLLGEIFRWRSKSDVATEVAIVVVPYILDVPEGLVEQEDVLQSELVSRGY